MLRENYPNPAFVRPRMKCLNGTWGFFDSFKESFVYENISCHNTRNIPDEQWENSNSANIAYISTFALSESDIVGSAILKIQEVYGDFQIWINKFLISRPNTFSKTVTLDITNHLLPGENLIVINLVNSAGDKEPLNLAIRGNIWLEFAAKSYFEQVVLRTSLMDSSVYLTGKLANISTSLNLSCELSLGDKVLATYEYDASPELNVRIPIPEPVVFWKELEGNLYDIKITLINSNGGVCDLFYSYVGFRGITISDNSFFINEKPAFLKFARDSKMLARHLHSPKKIRQFILSVLSLGFNGIDCSGFEPSAQFIYLADKLGLFLSYSLLPNNFNIEKADYTTILSLASSSLVRNAGSPSLVLCSLNAYCELDSMVSQNIIQSIISIRNDVLISSYSKTHLIGHFIFFPLHYSSDDQFIKDTHKITSSTPALFRFGHAPFAGAYSQNSSGLYEESKFLSNFKYMTRAMLASKALGYSYDALHDSQDNLNGLYLINGENKLSRNGQLSLKKYNDQRSISELNHILQKRQ